MLVFALQSPDPEWRAAAARRAETVTAVSVVCPPVLSTPTAFPVNLETSPVNTNVSHTLAETRAVWMGEMLPVGRAEHTGPGREARFGLTACLVLSQRKCPFRTLNRSVSHERRRKEMNPLDSAARTPAGWTGGPPPAMMTAVIKIRHSSVHFLLTPADPTASQGHGRCRSLSQLSLGEDTPRFVQSPTPTWFPTGSPQTGTWPERLHSSASLGTAL